MAIESLYFTEMEGGYPHAVNESTAAITNDSNQFYIDLGKSAAYGDMIVFSLDTPSHFTDGDTITGLEVVIEDAGTNSSEETNVDVEIYNPTEGGYSDTIQLTIDALSNPSSDDISAGNSTQKWGFSTWTYSDLMDGDFRVHVDNPIEPGAGIALMATFIYLKVHYIPADVSSGKIQLNSGLIQLTSGKVTL